MLVLERVFTVHVLYSLTPFEREVWENNYLRDNVQSLHTCPSYEWLHKIEWLQKIVAVINSIILPKYTTAVPLKFTINDSDGINAYALPYSTIVINRGLIQFIKPTWDELAFVIAHESAHILKLHSIDRPVVHYIRKRMPIDPINKATLSFIMSPFINHYIEFDADEFATRYLRLCGLDPRSGISLLSKLKQKNLICWNSLIQSTHPSISRRIERITNQIPLLDTHLFRFNQKV